MKKINITIITLALTSLMGCKKYAEQEVYLIPEGLQKVVVLFGQENGKNKQYEGNRRVYHIPQSGVLYSKFKRVQGILDQHFIYVDAQGNKLDTLPNFELEQTSMTKDYLLGLYDGKFSNIPDDKSEVWNTDDYPKTEFIFFTLGKPSEKESLFGEAQKLLDSVREAYPKQIW